MVAGCGGKVLTTHADYNALRRSLDTLTIPFLPMAGNHDDRDVFRSCLPLPDTCMDEFIQYTVSSEEHLLVCLDTQKSGSDAGEFCCERRIWLQETLKKAGETPVCIFMHHPPMKLGLPMQDTENMEDGEAFLDLISKYDCVKYLFIGHVHRPICGTVRGIPFATMRSVLYQAPAPRPEWTWETFKPCEEPPTMGVIMMEGSSVNLQYEQFCAFGCGVRYGACWPPVNGPIFDRCGLFACALVMPLCDPCLVTETVPIKYRI